MSGMDKLIRKFTGGKLDSISGSAGSDFDQRQAEEKVHQIIKGLRISIRQELAESVRSEAIGSIKDAPIGVSSQRGQPPHSHVSGMLGLRDIQIADAGDGSFVVGPVFHHNAKGPIGQFKTVPSILEFGLNRQFMRPAMQRTLQNAKQMIGQQSTKVFRSTPDA